MQKDGVHGQSVVVEELTRRGTGGARSVSPAWGDANLRHVAGHIESPLFLSYVRATSGSAAQEANCRPVRHDRWPFVHKGRCQRVPCHSAQPDA